MTSASLSFIIGVEGGCSMINIENARLVINRIVTKKGYTIEEHKSATTNSWYFKICCGEESLLFRLSDHQTYKDIITLRIDKVNKQKHLESFVNNRCKDLSDRIIKKNLGV